MTLPSGWLLTVTSVTRERTMPPSPRRPMNSVPSAVDVRLSGNARRPGSAIDCASAIAACDDTADESTATTIATRSTHRFNLTLEATTIDVSVYDTVGFPTRIG